RPGDRGETQGGRKKGQGPVFGGFGSQDHHYPGSHGQYRGTLPPFSHGSGSGGCPADVYQGTGKTELIWISHTLPFYGPYGGFWFPWPSTFGAKGRPGPSRSRVWNSWRNPTPTGPAGSRSINGCCCCSGWG